MAKLAGFYDDMFATVSGAASSMANNVEGAWEHFVNAPTDSYGNDMYAYDASGAPVNESLPSLVGDAGGYVVDAAGNAITDVENFIGSEFNKVLLFGGALLLVYFAFEGHRAGARR